MELFPSGDLTFFFQTTLQKVHLRRCPVLPQFLLSNLFCKAASLQDRVDQAESRYKARPWDYLESEGM